MCVTHTAFDVVQAQVVHPQTLVLSWGMLLATVFFMVIAVLLLVRLLLCRELYSVVLGLAGIIIAIPLLLLVAHPRSANRPPTVEAVDLSSGSAIRIRPQVERNLILVGHDASGAEEGDVLGEIESAGNRPRPAWIDQPTRRVGETERRVVSVGPWDSVDQCHRMMDEPVLAITCQFLEHEFGAAGLSPENLDQMGVNIAYVLREICTDEYVETSEHDFVLGITDEMKTLHVLMEFGPSVRNDLERRVQEYQRRANAKGVSLAAGAVFGVLSLAYGLLRIDTWTKGYYSKRLLIGVPVVIIMILVALLATT